MEIANRINASFLEPLKTFQAFNASNYVRIPDHTNNPNSDVLSVLQEEVFKCLKSINSSKSLGTDYIPPWILKELVVLLSLPIGKILNCSYEEQQLPSILKMSNTAPIPKSTPAKDAKKHLSPISLTLIL